MKTRGFCAVLLLFVVISCALLLCGAVAADTFDLSALEGEFVMPNFRQLLVDDDGQMLLVSTNGTKTMVAVMESLEGRGTAKTGEGMVKGYPMETRRALLFGGDLYLLGTDGASGEDPDCVRIGRVRNRSIMFCTVPESDCDFNRRFEVREKEFCIVTAPRGVAIDDNTLLYCYPCDFAKPAKAVKPIRAEPQEPAPELPSSVPPEPVSSAPESSSTPSSAAPQPPNVPWSSVDYFVFSPGKTRVALQEEYDKLNDDGGIVRVSAPDGSALMRGDIFAGCFVEVYLGVELQSRVTALVPGGLCSTEAKGTQLMSAYLTGTGDLTEAQFLAADLDGDGRVTACDLLLMRRANALFIK